MFWNGNCSHSREIVGIIMKMMMLPLLLLPWLHNHRHQKWQWLRSWHLYSLAKFELRIHCFNCKHPYWLVTINKTANSRCCFSFVLFWFLAYLFCSFDCLFLHKFQHKFQKNHVYAFVSITCNNWQQQSVVRWNVARGLCYCFFLLAIAAKKICWIFDGNPQYSPLHSIDLCERQ